MKHIKKFNESFFGKIRDKFKKDESPAEVSRGLTFGKERIAEFGKFFAVQNDVIENRYDVWEDTWGYGMHPIAHIEKRKDGSLYMYFRRKTIKLATIERGLEYIQNEFDRLDNYDQVDIDLT